LIGGKNGAGALHTRIRPFSVAGPSEELPAGCGGAIVSGRK
jgi:hypothetical protein